MQVIILVGFSGTGKTTTVLKYIDKMRARALKVGGIVCPGTFKNAQRFSFAVTDLLTNVTNPLAQRDLPSEIQQGSFGFHKTGIEFGNNSIKQAVAQSVDILVIDEIGPLELSGSGWYEGIQAVNDNVGEVIYTVRPTIIKDVQQKFFSKYPQTIIPVERSREIL
jgi:nucleoside-triphosphatase THEP1